MTNRVYDLRRTQKNEVFEAIETRGLATDEFEWGWQQTDPVAFTSGSRGPLLVHRPTGYSFLFDMSDAEHFWYRARPGVEAPEDSGPVPDWRSYLVLLAGWLNVVKQEREAEDLWEELSRTNDYLEATFSATDGSPMSEAERGAVHHALAEFRQQLLEEHSLDESAVLVVEERLAYLEDAIDRMAKQDWMHTSIGVFVTIVVQVAFAPEQARSIWAIFASSLQRAFASVERLIS